MDPPLDGASQGCRTCHHKKPILVSNSKINA
jgi:hypothetical protein